MMSNTTISLALMGAGCCYVVILWGMHAMYFPSNNSNTTSTAQLISDFDFGYPKEAQGAPAAAASNTTRERRQQLRDKKQKKDDRLQRREHNWRKKQEAAASSTTTMTTAQYTQTWQNHVHPAMAWDTITDNITTQKTKPTSIQPRPAGVKSAVSSQSTTTKSSSRNPTRTTSRRSSSTLRRSSSPILLQRCLDDYTSQGSWNDQARWVGGGPSNIGGKNTTRTSSSVCPSFDQHVFPTKEDIATAWSNLTIGFMGDSTTRSDLRAWEEEFGCPRTNLYEASLFQKKHPKNRTHICKLHEQSINLDKCGIPPILNMTQCPSPPNPPNNENDDQSSVVSFRYWYKVYPWTPLDQWYLQSPQSELFEDLDVLVISIGRWFKYRRSQHINVTNEIDQFLVELQKVYTGVILFQSPYAKHTVPVTQSTCPVPCTHGLMNEKWQCEATITAPKPKDDEDLRSVVVHHQPHPIPYIDRWDISTALPIEYYHTWLCEKPKFHSWFCDHHLSFVAMEHFRMIARVVAALSSSS